MKRVENILFFLTLLFLPTQLGRHFWPQFSFVYSLPIDYLAPTLYFWDILVIILVVVWLLNRRRINRLALNLLFIFMLAQMVSLIGQDVMAVGRGLVRLEQYLIAGLLGVYIASVDFNKIKPFFIWALGASLAAESILAMAQFIKGGTIGLWILGERSFTLSTPGIAKFDFYGLEFLRPYGTFPHPNVLAAFCVIVVLLVPRIVTFVPAAAAIFLTVSRTAILAGTVSAMWRLKKKIKIIFLILLVALLPILYTRFSSAFNFDILSFVRREEQAEIAIKMWSQSPLFGEGLNNFIPAASDQLLSGPSRFLQPVHNIFLLVLSETGLIGLIGLISLIGYPIWKRRLLSIWLVIIFLGMFDHYFLTLPQGYRLLFLVWGISLSKLVNGGFF